MKSIQTSYNVLQTDLLTLDQIGIDIIQCFVDICTETLEEIDTDIIQCFIDRLIETLDEIDTEII
jgi:hypothetical protein